MPTMTWMPLVRVLGAAPWQSVRDLGAGLDLARSTGPRYAWWRWREQRARTRLRWAAVFGPIWSEAAREVGAEIAELPDGSLELRKDGASARITHQSADLDDASRLELSLDKARVHALLVEAGLPVPPYLEFHHRDTSGALAFMESVGAPCVVKPASGTGAGSGVTSGVRTRADFMRARLRASRSDVRLIIERQVEGDMYRLLFLDGELLDVVRRLPPRVTADGRSTIAELIAAENRRRLAYSGRAGLKILAVDLECILTLQRQGFRLHSRLPDGVTCVVKDVVSQNGPAENETIREPPCRQLIAEAAAAARVVQLRLAGVDVVTTDLARSLAASGGAILEVNGTPGLHHHYQVADPSHATPVAVPILGELLLRAESRERR